MSDETQRYLIAYDVRDDRRRSRVATLLQSHGVRVQYSVFLVDLRPARVLRLCDNLERRIEHAEDSILVCRLGAAATITPEVFKYLGNSRVEPDRGPIVL